MDGSSGGNRPDAGAIDEVAHRWSRHTDSHTPTVVLIGGVPRSGTTMLVDALNENDSCAIMAEYRFDKFLRDLSPIFDYEKAYHGFVGAHKPEYFERSGEAAIETGASAGASRLAATGTQYYMPRAIVPLKNPVRFPRTNSRVSIATAALRAALGKPFARVIGSKDPRFVLDSAHLAVREDFPRVRYVFALREPLAQINSAMNRRNLAAVGLDEWLATTVEQAIDEYRSIAHAVSELVLSHPDDCFVVKYEDLQSDPQATFHKLGSFLKVPILLPASLLKGKHDPINVLTADENEIVHSTMGALCMRWHELALTGTGRSVLPALSELVDRLPSTGIDCGSAGARPMLVRGWSAPEEAGVWSDGPESVIVFRSDSSEALTCRIELNLAFFASSQTTRLPLEIVLNDRTLFWGYIASSASENPTASDEDVVILPDLGGQIFLGPVTLLPDTPYRLAFKFSTLTSPKREGLDDNDDRTLGVYLRSVKLQQ